LARDVDAQNVSAVSIDAARARVDCSAGLNVTTDGPLAVTLADCAKGRSRTLHFG
jgi:hypothetical protein